MIKSNILCGLLGLATITWSSLWWTADQHGQMLTDQQKFLEAAKSYQDPVRQGVALFRAGEFEQAERTFARLGSPEAEYNRGNCLVMQGKYQAAIERFDRALELRPDWEDALQNRAVAEARAKRAETTGGDMGDQKIGADEIVFDKNQNGGQDTELEDEQQPTDSSVQAMWLRKVQTKPGDFLKAKFAYQLSNTPREED